MKHLFIATLVFATLSAHASDINCKVIGISDGDTLTCLTASKEQIKVRLAQVDAPEKEQDFGQKSKQSLSNLAYQKDVILKVETTDKYRRTVATVMQNGIDVNLEQIKRGMVWVYTQYAHDPAYFSAEKKARASRIGLWAASNPIEPSKWRKGQTSASPSATQLDPIKAAATRQASSKFTCGKSVCREMTSCEEAQFHLNQCGVGRLDRDKDGVPCESLCQ